MNHKVHEVGGKGFKDGVLLYALSALRGEDILRVFS